MELLVSAKLAQLKFHGIPWNCSCHRNWRTLISIEFHGIPWNCSFHRNCRTPSSMEFHGSPWNFYVSEIGALEVPWYSMELLVSTKLAHSKIHVNPWNSMELLVSVKLAHLQFHELPWISMQLLLSTKLAHSKFHGIPWNCSCQRNWRIPSSMEFHGIAGVIEIGKLQVPWNSMELLVSAKLAHPEFHGIPWNCSCHRN